MPSKKTRASNNFLYGHGMGHSYPAGGKYAAAYNKSPVESNGKSPGSFSSLQNTKGERTEPDETQSSVTFPPRTIQPIKPKLVTIVKAGHKPRQTVSLLLNKRTMLSFEQLMTEISEAFGLPRHRNHQINKLYNVYGNEIRGLGQFFREQNVAVIGATPKSPLISEDAVDIHKEYFPGKSVGVALSGQKLDSGFDEDVKDEIELNLHSLSGSEEGKDWKEPNDFTNNDIRIRNKKSRSLSNPKRSNEKVLKAPLKGIKAKRPFDKVDGSKLEEKWKEEEQEAKRAEAKAKEEERKKKIEEERKRKRAKREADLRKRKESEEKRRETEEKRKEAEEKRREADEKRTKAEVTKKGNTESKKKEASKNKTDKRTKTEKKLKEENSKTDSQMAEQRQITENQEDSQENTIERKEIDEKYGSKVDEINEEMEAERQRELERFAYMKAQEAIQLAQLEEMARLDMEEKDGENKADNFDDSQHTGTVEEESLKEGDSMLTSEKEDKNRSVRSKTPSERPFSLAEEEEDNYGEEWEGDVVDILQAPDEDSDAEKILQGFMGDDDDDDATEENVEDEFTMEGKFKPIPRNIITEEDVFDKYSLGKKIGDGNFADVHVSVNKDSGEEFAMKIVDKSKLKNKENMIENEIAILKEINHPNIIRLYEELETIEYIYLIMEFVKGGDLFDAIIDSVKFTETDASVMVEDLTRALEYLHQMNVVHRDMKPENLLVSVGKSGEMQLKLADFGLAMEVVRPIYTVCGTPTYVAPEILAETGYGLPVDMWALGVITYILLCGFPPFRSTNKNQDELFEIIQSGQYEYISPYWDSISKAAKDLIDHLLVVDQTKRFTAQQVLQHPWIRTKGNTDDMPNLQREVSMNLEKNFKRVSSAKT